jgi:hypothetical protein
MLFRKSPLRAWVNFDGTGAIGANMTIRAGFNVASVVKVAAGVWNISFATPMPHADYVVTGQAQDGGGNALFKVHGTPTGAPVSKTVNQVQVTWSGGGSGYDNAHVHALVFA